MWALRTPATNIQEILDMFILSSIPCALIKNFQENSIHAQVITKKLLVLLTSQ
jgi:hypothetical protein